MEIFGYSLDPVALGALSAVAAGVLSLIPALGATDVRRNWTAIVVLLIASFVYGGFHYTTFGALLHFFVTAAAYALATYKFFLQTLVVQPTQRTLAEKNPSYRASMIRHSN